MRGDATGVVVNRRLLRAPKKTGATRRDHQMTIGAR
jgi:hypothetical protein